MAAEEARLRKNQRSRESKRRRLRARRLAALTRYGGKCACCGEVEPDFLCFDHKDGGGKQERATATFRDGAMFYKQLVEGPFRPDLQILCANCNMAKERLGGCPHQRLKEVGPNR